MLELCRTRLYRRQLLCDCSPPPPPLGNVFAHKYSENAVSLICTCYCLSGPAVTKEEGKQAGLLSGTGVPFAGRGAESFILSCGTANSWAETGASVALPSVHTTLVLELCVHVVSAES